MKTYFSRISASRLFIALPLFAQFAFAGPVEQTAKAPPSESVQAYHPMYFGTFNTGVKTSDVYTEGNVSFVVPLWSSIGSNGFLGGGTVFLEPYVSLGESGELASSLGLGWRYLFNDQPLSALTSDAPAAFLTEGFYIGANLFIDNLRTQFDNDFWQLGLGVEIGTRYLEMRGNYYLPFDNSQKLAERNTSTQNFTSQSRSSSTRMENGATPTSAPFATGHTIQQDANLTTTAVTTTRTTSTRTTIKTITSLFEEGMEGWDIEAAFLIPGLDQYLDVSLIGGYYSFDNQPFGPQQGGSGNTEGFKAGIEIRPVPALLLTGMWYEDEGLTGSDWVAGIGLQIPLGKDWKDAFKPRRRHLAERLGEPVARQNAAIKTARSYEVDQEFSQTSSTRTAVRRQVVSQVPGRITIMDDIVFVNGGSAVGNGIQAGSAGGNGTAEQPLDTIQAGADLAGNNHVATQRVWNVYTQRTPTPYQESVTISASTHFISSRTPILSPLNGAVFGGDPFGPVVQGGFAGDAAQFISGSSTPSFVAINGYHINEGYDSAASLSANIPGGIVLGDGEGIYLNNVDHVLIQNNSSTSATYSGIAIWHNNNLAATITDNTTNGNGGFGIRVLAQGNFDGQIFDNVANDNLDNGIDATITGDFSGNITGNKTTDNGRNGISAYAGGDFTGNISNNNVSDNFGNGIDATVNGTFTGDVSHNTSNANTYSGISLTTDRFIGNVMHNNVESNRGGQGIVINARLFAGNNAETLPGYISHNTANGNFVTGILVNINENFTGYLTSNTTSSNGANGLELLALGDFVGQVSDNTASSNLQSGIIFTGENFIGDFSNNTASNNAVSGINASFYQTFTGDWSSNTTDSNSGLGSYLWLGGNFTGNITGNTANANGLSGWTGYALADFTGNITDNTTNGNGTAAFSNGFSLSLSGSNVFDGIVTGNNSNNNSGFGFASGATAISGDSVTGPNNASGNVGGNFNTLIGVPIITETP